MDILRFDSLPYGRKGIFVDIPKGSQGAGRWMIEPNGRGANKKFLIKLNGVRRKDCDNEADAKAWVAFETNRVLG